MKKLIILICLFPFAALAQERIVSPKDEQPIGAYSISLKNRQQQSEVAGVGRQKLFAVLVRWCRANYRDSVNVDSVWRSDTCKITGKGMFMGSYTYHAESPTSNVAPVNFEVRFSYEIKVSDGRYSIAISRLMSHEISISGPDEGFQNPKARSSIPQNQGNFQTDITRLYAAIGEETNLDVNRLFRSASKYVAKAQKKGEL